MNALRICVLLLATCISKAFSGDISGMDDLQGAIKAEQPDFSDRIVFTDSGMQKMDGGRFSTSYTVFTNVIGGIAQLNYRAAPFRQEQAINTRAFSTWNAFAKEPDFNWGVTVSFRL